MTAVVEDQERNFPPRWYWIYLAGIGMVAVVGLLIGVIGLYATAASNKARDEQNTELLACFDRYAELQSASSVAVREASVAKDQATTLRDDALNVEGRAFQAVVNELLAGNLTPASVKRLAHTLEVRAEASEGLDVAQDNLDKARAENPVPKPPSQFCSVKP